MIACCARGLLLALPLLLIFGGLLVAADAAFAGLLARLFQWDLREIAIPPEADGVLVPRVRLRYAA